MFFLSDEKMAWTGYQIAGVIVILIGIALLIAGVVILALDQSNQKTSEWWVWALIIIGVIALIVGIALFFIPSPKTALEEQYELRKPGCPGNIPVAMAAYPRRMNLTPHPDNMCPGVGVAAVNIPVAAPLVAPIVRESFARRPTRGQLMPRADVIPSDVYCPQYQATGGGVLCPAGTAYQV